MKHRPKILWDNLGLEQKASGIYRYAKTLNSYLEEEGIEPLVLGREASQDFPRSFGSNFNLLKTFRMNKLLGPSLRFQEFVNEVEINPELKNETFVFHGLANLNLPIFSSTEGIKVKYVITIHDLIPLVMKKNSELQVKNYPYYLQMLALMPKVLKKADAIVCVSEWTKQTLLESRFSRFVPEEKISVILNGVESTELSSYISKEKLESSSQKIQVLSVCRWEPYKRFDLMIKILEESKDKIELHVVTDEKGERFLKDHGKDFTQKGTLKSYRSISNEELSKLYQISDVYLHPSLYEGFGLTIAEALTFSLPCVFQGGGAVEEVFGGEDTICYKMENTSSPRGWFDAILQASEEKNKPEFNNRCIIALNRLPKWKDTAYKLKKLYNNLIDIPHYPTK